MNQKLQSYARQDLKDGLSLLPEGWQNRFKRMYGNIKGTISAEELSAISINSVVDAMPEDKLDWAMIQVGNSLKSLKVKKE